MTNLELEARFLRKMHLLQSLIASSGGIASTRGVRLATQGLRQPSLIVRCRRDIRARATSIWHPNLFASRTLAQMDCGEPATMIPAVCDCLPSRLASMRDRMLL